MKKGGGKNKGNQFERYLCKGFSLWVSAGQRKDLFWRTAMSGGRATVHRKHGEIQRQAGDMCAVAPEGHTLTDRYFFEFKSYRVLGIPQFFLKGAGTLADFWVKTVKESGSYNKHPVLIARQDRLPAMVICYQGARSILGVVDTPISAMVSQIPVKEGDHFDLVEVILLEDLLATRYRQHKSLIRERL